MNTPRVPQFSDGAAYEQSMGKWSQLAGTTFLDWLMPQAGLTWVDIGCGNGAFTELISSSCAPARVEGIDPSEGQLAYARTRLDPAKANFSQGHAMELKFADGTFDAAVMALVIVFVSEPEKGVSEMARVVKPGGIVSAYVWDMTRNGFPLTPIQDEMRALGAASPEPPRLTASRLESLKALWAGADLELIETKEIVVERTFPSFDELWRIGLGANTLATINSMPLPDQKTLRERLRARLPEDAAGRITYTARANAIKGRRPG